VKAWLKQWWTDLHLKDRPFTDPIWLAGLAAIVLLGIIVILSTTGLCNVRIGW